MAERGPITGTSLYLVLKSNGLRHPKKLPVKFGFSPIDISANIAKKLPPQRCSKPLLIAFSTFPTNGPRSLSRAKVDTHSAFGEKSHTTAHTPKQGPSLPRPQHGFALPVKFLLFCHALYTYISRFSVNSHYQQREKIRQSCRHKFYPQLFLVAFSTSLTNGPRLLSRAKAGTHSAFGEGSHTAAHTPKQVVFWVGVVSLPSDRSERSRIFPGRVSERRTLPLLGRGRVYSRRTQRAFGTAMRLCASLFRGVAAPLGCVILVRMLIALLGGLVANFPALWYDKFNKLESVMH